MESQARHAYLRAFDEFLYKPAYFFLVGGLTIFANIFGAELFTYTCFILIALYLCLFGRDLLPIIPLAICSYITPSRANNPGHNDASVFSFANGGLYLLILAALLIAGIIYRLIRDEELGRSAFFKCKRKLLPGMLLLAGSYLLSGIGTEQWSKFAGQNLLFAFIQAAAIVVLYLLLTGGVKWDEAPKAYLAWTGMCVGYVLLAEILHIYLIYDVIVDGVILRSRIFLGWGNCNNIGALLAIMIPFPFFLTGKGKHTGIFYISGMVFLAGVLFSCSRNSIICAVVAYLASYTISLLHSRNARANITIHIISALLVLIVFLLFHDELLELFQAVIDRGWNSTRARIRGYRKGWAQFLQHPVFGGTFFPLDDSLYSWSSSEKFISFFPPRWHNTFIQVLASCGIAGFAAYCYHRVQTFQLFFKNYSSKKLFAFVSMMTLLVTSMLDCHFFNVGPTLFYSMLLAFVEKRLDTKSDTKNPAA